MNFMNIRHAFKSIPMQLDNIHSECHRAALNTLQWKGERILVKYMKVHNRCFRHLLFTVFVVCLLRFFIAATKSYGCRNGNPLVVTEPLQPWQRLTLLSQRLTKVKRTSLQVTSRIAFIKLKLYCDIYRF